MTATGERSTAQCAATHNPAPARFSRVVRRRRLPPLYCAVLYFILLCCAVTWQLFLAFSPNRVIAAQDMPLMAAPSVKHIQTGATLAIRLSLPLGFRSDLLLVSHNPALCSLREPSCLIRWDLFWSSRITFASPCSDAEAEAECSALGGNNKLS